jgi:DnaJ-domain-containing protein 1
VSGAKILVVANPYEATRIKGWLEGSSLPIAHPVRTGDGSDDTLADFGADPADVVVLCSLLDAGDALTLAGALRLDGPRHLKVVLIGDDRGPVRTALDAVDFGADRFLRRPLAEKALVFAVKSCLGDKPAPPATASAIGLASLAATASASSAFDALGELERVRLPASDAAKLITPGAPAPTVTDVGGLAIAATRTGGKELAERLGLVEQKMLDAFFDEAVSRTIDAAVGAELSQAVEYVAEPHAEDELSAAPKTGDFLPVAPRAFSAEAPTLDDAPPWREPTMILSDGGASGPPAAPPAPPPAAAPPPAVTATTAAVAAAAPTPSVIARIAVAPAPVAASTTPPVAESPVVPPPPAGTLARELKRTMSAIEKRLFGDEGTPAPENGEEPAPEPDIDLDKIGVGVDTLPGLVAELGGLPRAPLLAPTLADAAGDANLGDTRLGDAVSRARPEPTKVDLAKDDVAALIARLCREGWTGRAVFRRGDVEKGVFLDAGRPVFATSNLPHDRMGDLLFREGKITREQHARSREIVAETGRRMGEILVELGFLKRRELLPAVRRHVEDVIYSLFAWDDGSALLEPTDPARDEKIRLATHPSALVLEGIRRKYDAARLEARLGGPQTVIAPLKRDEVTTALAEADLSLEERAAAEMFDGHRTLADVAAATHLDESAVAHLAYGLVVLGLARRDDRGAHAHGSSLPAAPLQVTTGGGVSASGDVAIDRERVLAKHALVLEADYFTVLGVRRDASAFEIKRAYEAARRDYAPEALPGEIQRELAAPLSEIAEAYRVLRDARVREQYLAHLRE